MQSRHLAIAFAALTLFVLCVGSAFSADVPEERLNNWPCWRGYDGSGWCPSRGEEMVDTFDQAKLLWYAREPIMQAYGCGCTNPVFDINGGEAGPIVADGRVFQ